MCSRASSSLTRRAALGFPSRPKSFRPPEVTSLGDGSRFCPGVGNSSPTNLEKLCRKDCRACARRRAAFAIQVDTQPTVVVVVVLRGCPCPVTGGGALPQVAPRPPISETSGLSQRFAIAMSLRRERNPGLLAARPAVILAMSIFCPRFEIAAPAPRKVGRQRFVHPIAVARDPAICHPVGDKRLTFRKDRGSNHSFGSDSDLEAFSRNPAKGSFAPSARRPSTRTKRSKLWFLSY